MKSLLFFSLFLSAASSFAQSNRVQLFHSDSCHPGELVALVRPSTKCEELKSAPRVWGVMIGDDCMDVPDSDALIACTKYKDAGAPDAVHFFHSDSCNPSEFITGVSRRTNCSELASLPRVWGIKVGKDCNDITDTDAPTACTRYKEANHSQSVKLYHSDSCSESEFVGSVHSHSKCAELASMPRIWAVKLGDKCMDISDTDAPSACSRFKDAMERDAVHFFHSDSCSSSEYITSVSRGTDCNGLGSLSRVWAVMIDGKCQDISDLDAVAACQRFKN